jgi:DUF917 family protein
MGTILIDQQKAEAAAHGGAVLGGGGGGGLKEGLERASLAVHLGRLELKSLDELDDDDLVVTASAVGAPAAKDQCVRPVDHIKSLDLLVDQFPGKIAGIISNENGGSSGVNGWLQAAVRGLPMIDAPANGRAHPTGLMGAMGIHRIQGYRSIQTAVGGDPEAGRYLEMVARGGLEVAANLVRYASIQAGGLVAVSRDPVQAAYLREHAAPGGSSFAIKVGEEMMSARSAGSEAVIEAIASVLGGSIACRGEIVQLRIETTGGYDIGSAVVQGDNRCELIFWNEFMTMEIDGQRRGTFPDLMTLLSLEAGLPVSSAEIIQGDTVAVLFVARDNIPLGAGVKLPETIREAEIAIGKPLLDV